MKYNNTKNRGHFYLDRIAEETDGYENGKIIDLRTKEGRQALYESGERLKNDGNGGLLYFDKNEDGTYDIINEELCNTLILGSTGTGKTTRYLIPYAIHTAKQGKANLVITSTKEDNYNVLTPILKECGYEIKLINNKMKPEASEGWNLFDIPIIMYMEGFEAIGNGVAKVKDGFSYKEKIYKNNEELSKCFKMERKRLRKRVYDKVREILGRLDPINIETTKDAHWQERGIDGKAYIVCAMIFNIYSVDKLRMKPEQITLENANLIYEEYFKPKKRGTGLEDNGYITRYKEIGKEYSDHFLTNAGSTISNYISFLTASMRSESEAFYQISRHSTINIEEDFSGDKKIAYFLIADEVKEKSRREFSFLATNAILEPLRDLADKSENSTLKRPAVFLLDEFANMPKNEQFVRFCSTCRSRNIYLHYLIQNEEQLDATYGQMDSATIKNNCSTQIFLGSNNAKCIQAFAERFGKRTMPTNNSLSISEKGGVVYDFVERPVVTYSELESLREGTVYIKRDRGANFISHLTAFYEVDEFNREKANMYEYKSRLSQIDTSYLPPSIDEDEDDDDDIF